MFACARRRFLCLCIEIGRCFVIVQWNCRARGDNFKNSILFLIVRNLITIGGSLLLVEFQTLLASVRLGSRFTLAIFILDTNEGTNWSFAVINERTSWSLRSCVSGILVISLPWNSKFSGGFKVGGARGKTKKGGPADDVIILSQPL